MYKRECDRLNSKIKILEEPRGNCLHEELKAAANLKALGEKEAECASLQVPTNLHPLFHFVNWTW